MELDKAIDSRKVDSNLKSASVRNGFVDKNYVDSGLAGKSNSDHSHNEYEGMLPKDGSEFFEGALRIQSANGSKLVLIDEHGEQAGLLIHNRATNQISLLRYDDAQVVESGIMLGSDGVSLIGPDTGVPVVESPQDIATKQYVDDQIPVVLDKTYEYTKVNNIVLTEAEVLVATVDLASIPEGVYELGYSFEVNFGGIKDKSVHFRMDIDGVAGTEFDTQSDKRANHKNRRYSYPKPRVAGPCKMEFYMWKQSGVSQEIVLDWCDVTIEWKKS